MTHDDRSQAIYEPEQPSFGDERPPNVLWGRVIVLGVALLLVFLLGRATGGASNGEIESLQERVQSLQAQNDQLEAAARSRATAPAPPPAGDAPSPAAGDAGDSPAQTESPAAGGTDSGTTASPSPEAESSTTLPAEYTVQSGENFSTISRDFYGSGSFAKCIMQANEYAEATDLKAGDDITIPEKPANPCS
ncbi:MAG: LysM domain-containing protein [Actinomycetota bacterium]